MTHPDIYLLLDNNNTLCNLDNWAQIRSGGGQNDYWARAYNDTIFVKIEMSPHHKLLSIRDDEHVHCCHGYTIFVYHKQQVLVQKNLVMVFDTYSNSFQDNDGYY